MYLSYSKMWTKMYTQNITIGEFSKVSGVNISTLDKIRRLKSISTDNILKICNYFECDVIDVIGVVDKKLHEVYYSLSSDRKYKGNRKNDCYTTCEFDYMDKSYAVHKLRKRANGNSVIFCSNGGLLWRQIYFKMAIPGIVMFDDFEIFDVTTIDDNKVNIVIIPGVPGNINSLDEYAFTSWRSNPKTKFRLYLMTEKAFRNFEPIHELVL